MRQKIWQIRRLQDCAGRCIKVVALWAAIAMVLFNPSWGHAQNITASQVNGTVTDSTGAVVPGPRVTVTNTPTGILNKATTDGTGV